MHAEVCVWKLRTYRTDLIYSRGASSRWGYHLVCDGDSINVVDLTPNVAWPNIYSRRIEREPTGVANSDVQIMLTGVRCDAEDTTLGACEIALKFLFAQRECDWSKAS